MDTAFTARNVAKWVAKSIVAMKTTELTANAVADYSRFEDDDMIVRIGAGVVGWGVSAKLEPVTDAIVDKAADFVNERYNKWQAKRETQKEQ